MNNIKSETELPTGVYLFETASVGAFNHSRTEFSAFNLQVYH